MNPVWIFFEGSTFFHNMAELKYYNFNISFTSVDLPTPVSLGGNAFAFHHWCQKDWLGYFPSHRFSIMPGYDIPDNWDANTLPGPETHAAAWNVKPLFYSDDILPISQGVTDSTVVGDKYRWRSTMIDLTLNPQRYQELFKSPALNVHINAVLAKNQQQLAGAIVPGNNTGYSTTYSKGVNSGGTMVSNGNRLVTDVGPSWTANVAFASPAWTNDEYEHPGVNNVPILARTGYVNESYGATLNEPNDGLMNVGFVDPGQDTPVTNDPISLYYEYFPLYRMPSYRPFFYCRLVVFKLKFSQNDYQTFRSSQYYQNLFLNSIWWNRFNSDGYPNMSIRTNDFNVNTPCGGTFDLKYNKLLQINPFKNYRFRINLYSVLRRGDPVEIRRNTIFADPTIASYPFYKNAQYCAYLLPPLDVQQDFDAVSSLLISAGSIYDTNHFVPTANYNMDVNPSYTYGPFNPFSVPMSVQKFDFKYGPDAHAYRFAPTFLPLCSTKITGRTAYWD